MLSIEPLDSAESASDYYLETYNYYKDDSTAMCWHGKGSELLNLPKEGIEKETMLSLLKGEIPDGQMIKKYKGKHRPGFDMTFSAPKSVSLLVGLGVAPKLQDFHDEAVNRAISQIEAEFAEMRVIKNDMLHFEKTGNLTIATFRQLTSRANDPDLHTHCVVMNFTFDENGKARALASDSTGHHGVVEQLQKNLHYAGLLYRHHLANLLKEDGFQLRFAGDGLFEINGIPKEVLREFSSRRIEIETYLHDNQLSGAEASSEAAIKTRAYKKDIPLEALKEEWNMRCDNMEFDAKGFFENRHKLQEQTLFEKLKEKIKDSFYPIVDKEKMAATDAARVAIEIISQKTSVFSGMDIKAETMKHTLICDIPISQASIDAAISDKKTEQALYEARCPYTNKPKLTTPWLLTLEAEMIARIEANKGCVKAIASSKEVDDYQKMLDKEKTYPLTPSQKEAMRALLTTTDRFIAIQGYAGVAKTTMLKDAKVFLEAKGFKVRGLTVASSASNEMSKKAGIHADVFPIVHGELKKASDNSLQNTVFIADESSMLSSPQGHELTKLIEQKGARLIFIGDKAQFPSVKNGKTFGLTQEYGIHTTVMKDIVRQKNEQALQSVEHATRGEIYDALSKVNEVRELKTHESRIKFIAEAWLNSSQDVRSRTLVFAPTHKNRKDITSIMREGLQKEGVLKGEVYTQTVLKARPLEEIQLRFTANFDEGNVIRFNKEMKRFGIESGDYLSVGAITKDHRKNNMLPLINENGKTVLFHLNSLPQYKTHTAAFTRIMEVYESQELELQEGDTLLWCRNFKKEGIINSERATLLTIDDNFIECKLEQGDTLRLDKNHPALKHLDHGYVLTNFKVQGKDSYYGMGLLESYHKFSATLTNFYVQISRAVSGMTIVTDDKNNLIRALELNDDQKKSALEAVTLSQLKSHQERFNVKNPIDASLLLDKKSLKDDSWHALESIIENYKEAKNNNFKTKAARLAHQIISSNESIRMANARLGFHYQTYRKDALAVSWISLIKNLSDSERANAMLVKSYVRLERQTHALWAKSKEPLEASITEKNRDQAFKLSIKRDALAFSITQKIEDLKPYLTHFSIGGLNRAGVPQFQYDNEHKKAITKLEKLSEHVAKHIMLENIKSFSSAKNDDKPYLASLICHDAKTAHPYVIFEAKHNNVSSESLWKDIREHARDFKDSAYRDTLPLSEKVLFDQLKSYKWLSHEISLSWKEAFKSLEKNQPLPETISRPIKELNHLKSELAHQLSDKASSHKHLFEYFNLDETKVINTASLHTRLETVRLFLKPTINFKEKMEGALAISEDLKSYYPLIKELNVPKERFMPFLKIASRTTFLEPLTEPEKKDYYAVVNYKHASKKTGAAWKHYFDTKNRNEPTHQALGNAMRLSSKRDAIAFTIQNNDAVIIPTTSYTVEHFSVSYMSPSIGEAFNKENVFMPALQEHSQNHLTRLQEITSLNKEHFGLLMQLEQVKEGITSFEAKVWHRHFNALSKNMNVLKKSDAYQYALRELPLSDKAPQEVKELLDLLQEFKRTEGKPLIHEISYQKIDASIITDALMSHPETTYKAIFGEPKKIAGNTMHYPDGLKVTLHGKGAGLWNHFGEMKGGSPIQAIMYSQNISFKEALTIASKIAGVDGLTLMPSIKKEVRDDAQKQIEEASKASALSIWKSTTPLKNTLGETYLSKHRGINNPHQLTDVKFWPTGAKWQTPDANGILIEKINKIPALVIAARNHQNEVTGVQRIYLDNHTGSKNTFMEAAKLSKGLMKESGGVIQVGQKNGRVYIAEGPETGASIAMADTKATVMVSFSVSNMSNLSEVIKRFNPKEVIIAADNDGKKEGEGTRLVTEKAADILREKGLNTKVIYPSPLPEFKKTDWNDVLIHEGLQSIQKQLNVPVTLSNEKNIEIKKPDIDFKNPEIIIQKPDIALPKNPNTSLDNNPMSRYIDSFEKTRTPSVAALNNHKVGQLTSDQLKLNQVSIPSQSLPKSEVKMPEKVRVKEMEI